MIRAENEIEHDRIMIGEHQFLRMDIGYHLGRMAPICSDVFTGKPVELDGTAAITFL